MARGALVVSFDFELAWGDPRRYRGLDAVRWLARTHDVVPKMLESLHRYRVPATWATVGHLMLTQSDCPGGRFRYDLPAPKYGWFEGNWYEGIPAYGEDGWQCFYAPNLVEQIVNCPTHQELASHTFSHIDVGDRECSEVVARAEMAKCQEVAQRNWGRTLHSVVFPHNFIGHLSALEETGYTCFRGVGDEWYWLGLDQNVAFRWRPSRIAIAPLRYLDERLPVCPPLRRAERVGNLWKIGHSMFFPGYTGVSKYIAAEGRVRRAKIGMERAAEQGRLFSLYTHPENLIDDTNSLLDAFDAICREAAAMRDAGKIDILTMEQAAERLEAGNTGWTD